jgi:hypothetical protein
MQRLRDFLTQATMPADIRVFVYIRPDTYPEMKKNTSEASMNENLPSVKALSQPKVR